MEAIMPVINEALITGISNSKFLISNECQNPNDKCQNNSAIQQFNNCDLLSQITHVAVTNGPGLIGSLLVGFNAAKAIAYGRNLPLIPINHIEGHIYSAFGGECQISNFKFLNKFPISNNQFPVLALTVSGGHTSLTLMHDHGRYQTIGETIDDAAGESFDKVAKLLGLGYPGGPAVSRMAEQHRRKMSKSLPRRQAGKIQMSNEVQNPNVKYQIKFPRPLLDKPNFDFSFSGLKTAVLTQVIKILKNRRTKELKNIEKQEICWAFEEATVDVLVSKTLRAARKYHPRTVILAGGVAANRRLRRRFAEELKNLRTEEQVELLMPPLELCGDNAAMIGIAAYYHIITGEKGDWHTAKVDANATL